MNNINISWELVKNELKAVETTDPEILTDQILYSVCRQLRELSEIKAKTEAMLQELEHVQNFMRGLE
jgi:hypothetical protein